MALAWAPSALWQVVAARPARDVRFPPARSARRPVPAVARSGCQHWTASGISGVSGGSGGARGTFRWGSLGRGALCSVRHPMIEPVRLNLSRVQLVVEVGDFQCVRTRAAAVGCSRAPSQKPDRPGIYYIRGRQSKQRSANGAVPWMPLHMMNIPQIQARRS